MKGFSKEVKIALVAIMGLVILFFGMNFLKGLSLFSDNNTYYIKFTNISGLSESCQIFADGFKVGTIKSINYDYSRKGGIVAVASIHKELNIPQGTTAEISSDLLGNVRVDLIFSDSQQFVPNEGQIDGRINGGAMAKIGEMVPQVQQMLPKVDSILVSVNTLLADPHIAGTLHHVYDMTNGLRTTTAQLNTLMAQVNSKVPQLMDKAGGVLDHTNQLADNAGKVADNLAQLDLQAALNELQATMSNLKNFTEKLNSNEGSLGLLMNDQALYRNLNATIQQADSLLVNLREHPKRYVHFSLFGRKDK